MHDLSEFSQIVGPENISAEPAVLEQWARTTLPQKGTRPLGVVRPANREEVQAIVKLAVAQKIPLYPLSTGKNWGFGDACAPMAGCLIVELSRMNRIVEVNTELAYAIIEPGVTQGQLIEHLQKNNIPLVMDFSGAGPDTSLVGNTLDGGIGHSAYGDRFVHSCNYEVVLPDGSFLTTGFGSYPQAQGQHVYKWGTGPSLDSLFVQSNFGIVTRMTMWLMPKPEAYEYFFATFKTPDAIAGLVETFRRLRLQQTINSIVQCLNDRRLLASRRRYPWDQADGKQALEKQYPEIFRKMCLDHGVPAWTAIGILQGSAKQTAAARETVRDELRRLPGFERIHFFNERKMRVIKWLCRFSRPWLPAMTVANSLTGILIGIELLKGTGVSYETLRSGHWRGRGDPGTGFDPLNSGSGLIWLCPVLPATRQAVYDLRDLAEPIFHEFGFEYQTTLSSLTPRAVLAVLSLSFDHGNSSETTRAEQCGQKLTDALVRKGFIPFRGSPAIIARVRQQAPDYWNVLSTLKRAWDPLSILAPGRYIPPND